MLQHPTPLEPKIAIASEMQSAVVRGSRRPNTGAFEKLVQDLKDALGPSSGLTSEDVNVEHLTRLMEQYDPADKGWRSYFFGNKSRNYTRNLVDEGNGKSNLVGEPHQRSIGRPRTNAGPSLCLSGRRGSRVPSMTTAMLIA